MKIVVDTHTHTVASGHAYSTVQEMARGAADNGIEMFGITDHGPSLPGGPGLFHFWNLKVIPETIYGVKILKGAEVNITDYDGGLDLSRRYMARLDYVMASFHDVCIKPSSVEDHTRAAVKVLSNPFVDALSHPGNPQFQVDVEKVVLAAKKYGKRIEINNHSFLVRTGSEENCRKFVQLCKKHEVPVFCGSDAHISFDVGRFNNVMKLFEEEGMPEELVTNTSVAKVMDYLGKRPDRIKGL